MHAAGLQRSAAVLRAPFLRAHRRASPRAVAMAAAVTNADTAFTDHSSQSNYPTAKVTHTAFDVDVDFDSRTIAGRVVLSVLASNDVDELVLDTRDLAIEKCVVDGADATKAVIRIDGYRLLKMLLSVFVDTTPPADAFVGKPIKTQSKASRREAATRDLSSAMETVEVRPKPKLPPAAVATAKPEPSPTPSAEATKEIALYHATLRAAVTDAVGKYAAALFPKEVPKQSIDEAQTKLDALAQDLLTKIIDDDAEIVDEAPMACKSYARAKESIRQGLGTPGAESPAVGASSTRDVARAILATPAIKRAVEPMLKLAVQSVKTMSATNRPVPVPRMDREPEPSL